MRSGNPLCSVERIFGQCIIQMLAAVLILMVAIEKEPTPDISQSLHLIVLSEEAPLVRRCVAHSTPQKDHCENLLYGRSQHLYKVAFYFTLEENWLNIVARRTQDSELSASFAKQKGLDHYDLATSISFNAWKQELISQRSVHFRIVVSIQKVTTSSSQVIIFIIWIYRFHQINTTNREKELTYWKNQKKIRNQAVARHTMLPAYVVISLSAMVISTVIGFVTNSFIIVAHGMDRAKSRNINPRELILFTLGLFNITYQCSMAANDTVLYLWSDLYFSEHVYAVFSVLLLFTIFSSFWFTFCLCGFYYVMLVTSEQTFFMRLKQGISEVVPWMLISSVLLSSIISVPVAWNITKDDYFDQVDGNITSNSSVKHSTRHMSLHYLLVTSIIGCCVPLVLVAVSNILIIKSLCIHAKQLGRNAGGMNVQSVDASVSAARTVTSLLLLYISFYVSQILLIMGVFDVDSLGFSIGLVVIYAYSPIQSVILILGSPKLKNTLIGLLGFLRSKQNKPSHKHLKAMASQIFSVRCNPAE